MNLYGILKDKMFNESSQPKDVVSISDMYDFAYRIMSRLQDMDDFTEPMLQQVATRVDRGQSFQGALLDVIEHDYEFADSSYFKETINYLHNELRDIFDEALHRPNPEEAWNRLVHYLFNTYKFNYLGKEYTFSELRDLVEKGE